LNLHFQFQSFLQPEVGSKKDGAFLREEFFIEVFKLVFGPFNVINKNGEENFFFLFGCYLEIVNREVLDFDIDEIVFFSDDISNGEIRQIGSRRKFQAAY
jgi:hypothetical protein